MDKTNDKPAGQQVSIGVMEYKKIFDYCLSCATCAHEVLQNVELIMKLDQKATEQEAAHIFDLANRLNTSSSQLLDFVSFIVSLNRKT